MALFDFFKSKEEIIFPTNLRTNPDGFDFLAELLNRTNESKKYIFDFNDVVWIEANLCAILGAIIITNQKKGARFEFINLKEPYLNQTLKNNGFLELIKGIKPSLNKNSGVPFKEFDMKSEDEVEEYIYNYVLLSKQVPSMSEGAKKKIYRSIFEIYQNSIMHSGADKIFVCGQFYSLKKRMALTMVEIGRTFKHNVTNYKSIYKNYSGMEAIEWAVQTMNTTKSDAEAGGLGLDLIREFLKLNEGKLQIRSADGYWEEKKGIIFAKESVNNFEGSIVNIEFNLFDNNEYYVAEDFDIKDIF